MILPEAHQPLLPGCAETVSTGLVVVAIDIQRPAQRAGGQQASQAIDRLWLADVYRIAAQPHRRARQLDRSQQRHTQQRRRPKVAPLADAPVDMHLRDVLELDAAILLATPADRKPIVRVVQQRQMRLMALIDQFARQGQPAPARRWVIEARGGQKRYPHTRTSIRSRAAAARRYSRAAAKNYP